MQMLRHYNQIETKEQIVQILSHPGRLFYDSLLAKTKGSDTGAVYITLVNEMNNLETEPSELIAKLTEAMPKQKWLWEEYNQPEKVKGLTIDSFKQLNSLLLV